MEKTEILKKMKVIFDDETRTCSLGYKNIFGSDGFAQELVYDNPNTYGFKSCNVELLKSLLSKLHSEQEKSVFWSELNAAFLPNYRNHDVVVLAFETMFKLARIKDALSQLRIHFDVTSQYVDLLKWLSNNLRYEHYLFGDEDLDFILKWVHEMLNEHKIKEIREKTAEMERRGPTGRVERLPKVGSPDEPCLVEQKVMFIRDQVNEIQHQRLSKELLENVNREINQDKDKVEEKISHFGFSEELSGSLDKVEEEYRKAGTKFDFKTCIDHSRSFLENLNIEVVPKIEAKSGVKFAGDYSVATQVIDYFKRKDIKFLTEKEYAFYKATYDLASTTGVHRLVSRREFARICKNIVIELALLTLQRLEKYLV